MPADAVREQWLSSFAVIEQLRLALTHGYAFACCKLGIYKTVCVSLPALDLRANDSMRNQYASEAPDRSSNRHLPHAGNLDPLPPNIYLPTGAPGAECELFQVVAGGTSFARSSLRPPFALAATCQNQQLYTATIRKWPMLKVHEGEVMAAAWQTLLLRSLRTRDNRAAFSVPHG